MAENGFPCVLTACVVPVAVGALAFPAPADARYAVRTIAKGSQGSDVKHLQRYLTKAGFRTGIDGHFGRRTVLAQRRFERSTRRRIDGRASRGEQRLVQRVARRRAVAASPRPEDTATRNAVLAADGRTAIAPEGAPQQVKDAIAAANEITRKPYRYGGGHGRWRDSGYDCSGAVSYALHGGGLLDRALESSGLARWGARGKGRWITVYANSGHAYVVIAGLRYDTSRARGSNTESGPRWRDKRRSSRGYAARHPAGL